MLQIKGWFLLALGVGLVAIAVQGAWRGWLPIGRNGYKPGAGVFRDSQPLGFWFFFPAVSGRRAVRCLLRAACLDGIQRSATAMNHI